MLRKSALAFAPALFALAMSLTGCRYADNRAHDFMDIFQIGGGLTTENPESGMLPPSLGIHVQATDFLNLGALHFSGYGAEWDGRGLFAGRESRTRLGLGPWQRIRIDQRYAEGSENYFKKLETMWADRLSSPEMRFWDRPAKELHHEALLSQQEGCPILHRGWQYWENFGAEVSISEPFLTHFGFNFRVGFDPSEISDFVLGFLTVDYKHDDLTPEEYLEKVGTGTKASRKFKPASDEGDESVVAN